MLNIIDIIVYNGIITNYSIIKPFLSYKDTVRLANQEEIRTYLKFQK